MSNVICMLTGEPVMSPADMEVLATEVWSDELKLVVTALKQVKDTLNTLCFADAELMAEATRIVPLKDIAKLFVELDDLARSGCSV